MLKSASSPSSQDIYTLLQRAIADAESIIHAACGDKIGVMIYAGSRYGRDGKIEFQIKSDAYSDLEVKGRDFWDCVDEYLRRRRFSQRQEGLLLGAPVLDAEKL